MLSDIQNYSLVFKYVLLRLDAAFIIQSIIILFSCHKYLGRHVLIDSMISQEDCAYINLVLGKYQYTETGMVNLEAEFT